MKPLSDLQADWPAINRLLDEALELPPAERSAWLAALPAEAAGLRDTVARLLAASGGVETGDFLHTLPKLGGPPAGPAATGAVEGAEVGPWRLLREIGEGGMGSVWLAERADGSLKRQVALKLPRLSWARGLAERMARERDILATLEHPHIARLYDAGVDALGRPWLALEYVQGRPIDEHAKDKALTVRQRVELLLQVCEAVAYAHSRLVIHRDLKPGNILVTEDGKVTLLDFGIAKIVQGDTAVATALTELAGRALTLDYASPEQVRGEPLTTASDVYSLGVVAYELLSGSRPYKLRRGSAAELEEAIENAEVPAAASAAKDPLARQALKGDLDAILNQALQKASAQRYQSVDALAGDLARHIAGEPVVARPDTLRLRARRFARRYPLPLSVAGIIALALLGGAHAQAAVMVALGAGVLLAAWQRRAALQQAERAREEAAEARRQRARAEVVKGFALGLFEGADIELGGTVHTTALDLLKRAEADLAASPEGDAETALELRVALARSLLGLDQAEAALRVLDAADASTGSRVVAAHPLRLRMTLARADALQHLKRHAEAAPLLDALLPRLSGHPVLEATALRLRASGRYVLGQYTEALADARAATSCAEAGGDRLELLRALNEQTRLLAHMFQGERLASAERALVVARECDPRRHALPILTARELFASASCFEGDARRGLEEFRSIVADLEASLGPQHSRVSEAHNARAGAQYQCGDSEGALLSLQRCMAIEAAEHGPDTLSMRQGRAGMGGVLVNEGLHDEGLPLLRQAYGEFTAHEGPRHPITRVALSRLIAGLIKAGHLDEAEQQLQALASLGLDSQAKRDEWNEWQAQLLRSRGLVHEALALLEPMQQRRLASPMLHTRGVASGVLGALRVDVGQHAEAIEPLRRALDIFGGRHPYGSAAISRVQVDLGRALLAQGEAAAAVVQMRLALAYWDAHGPDRPPAAETSGWLALGLHAAGEPDEAREAGKRAFEGLRRTDLHRVAALRLSLIEAGLAAGAAD
jgi:tetratricopeptide (TPR) repeat protein/predicted Ser/Thr protein kinase